ncbi:MAG: hypothetical protein KA120_04170 [Candidatus Goldbacteria bacterium]|nr:hypothetical protein [Candidatus Goldiibacteriota bacterium]
MKLKNKKAQAMVEYVLIIFFVAFFCISALKIFKVCMNNAFENFVFVLSIPIP